MTDTTSPSTTTPSKPATPFPMADGAKPSAAGPSGDTLAGAVRAAEGEAAPAVDGLIQRATRGAHAAVDRVSDKVSSVADGLRGRVDDAGDARDEWIESARDAIRQHPFAAVAGALVIGAALLSLRSSRDR